MPWRILQYTDGQESVDFTLFDAAYAGLDEAARWLIEQGVEVNDTDVHGWTPLMYAAYAGHESTVQLLLNRGADAGKRSVPMQRGAWKCVWRVYRATELAWGRSEGAGWL